MRSLLILALLLGPVRHAAALERETSLPRRRVVVTSSSIEVFERIRFRSGTTTIARASTRMLEVLATTLAGNPDLRLVEVRVRAPTRRLAVRRARTIVDELVARGIAPDRMRAVGVRDPQSADTEIFIVERGEA